MAEPRHFILESLVLRRSPTMTKHLAKGEVNRFPRERIAPSMKTQRSRPAESTAFRLRQFLYNTTCGSFGQKFLLLRLNHAEWM